MTMNVEPRKADSLPPRPADDSKSSIMDGSGGSSKILKASSTSANAATVQWLRSKDPRIVRVSRAFGGKDRHSKVCTIKGLRDRRVRLSVPTAIQLYDLQDRLGLSQPSKVVDWLLDAAKHEIDELPPLPIQPGCEILGQINQHQSSALSTSSHHHKSLGDSSASKEGFLVKPSSPTSKLWIGNRHGDDLHHENENWTENNEEGTEGGNVNGGDDVASRSGNSSSSLYLEPTNYASLPNSALLHGLTSHMEHQDPHNFNLIPLSLHTSSSPSNHSQILLCPPLGVTAATTGTTPSYFPSLFMAASSASESTPRPSSSSGSHNLLLPTSLTTTPLFSHHMYMRSATRFISGNAANDGLDHSSQRSFASDGPSKNP